MSVIRASSIRQTQAAGPSPLSLPQSLDSLPLIVKPSAAVHAHHHRPPAADARSPFLSLSLSLSPSAVPLTPPLPHQGERTIQEIDMKNRLSGYIAPWGLKNEEDVSFPACHSLSSLSFLSASLHTARCFFHASTSSMPSTNSSTGAFQTPALCRHELCRLTVWGCWEAIWKEPLLSWAG